MRETWSDEPLDRLQALADEGGRAAQGLPGTQVRLLGARRRRRRLATTTGAVVMAVAVVAGGAFAALDRLGGTSIEPADPSPTRPVDPSPTGPAGPSPSEPAGPRPTVIPPDYRIDRELADYGSDGEVQGPSADIEAEPFQACERTGWPENTVPIDQLGVRSTAAGDIRHIRLVRLYGDAEAADAVVRGLVDVVAGCSGERDGGTVMKYEGEQTTLGDGGLKVLISFEVDGLPVLGMEQLHAIRVGSAVLIVSESGEYEPGSDVAQTWVDDLTDVARSLADDLRECLAGASCPSG